MMNHRYTYLKTDKKDSPVFVHLTLMEDVKKLRIAYSCGWWIREKVNPRIFEYWMREFANMAPALTYMPSSKKKSPIRTSLNKVEVKGKCLIYSTILKELIGFVEPNTAYKIPAKIEAFVNRETKVIEVRLEMDYAPLGLLVAEMRKMGIFSDDPNREHVRARLSFFKMSYLVDAPSGLDAPEFTKHVRSPAEVVVTPTQEVEEFQLDEDSCPGSALKKE